MRKILAIFGICFLTIPSLALARAGDGHGGSSTSSPSSSSRSSSSSPSFSSHSVGNFASSAAGGYTGASAASGWFSWIGILIILVIIAFVIMKARKNGDIKGGIDIPDMDLSSTDGASDETLGNLDVLKAHDPLFNEQKFKELVNIAFYKIQNAWCATDMSGARAFISDGIMRRFSTQLEGYKRDGRKNVLEGLSLDAVTILGTSSDESYDYITTLVTATAKDYTVDANWEVVSGNKESYDTWSEKWIFMRSSSVQTKSAESGIFADKCPNCGASLAVNAIGKCDYCGTEVNKGEFDWVLSEIVQIS